MAKSLARGEVAHAQILGMFLPFAKLGLEDGLSKAYDPNEPRVPAGSGRTSGQWTSSAIAGTSVPAKQALPAAAGRRYALAEDRAIAAPQAWTLPGVEDGWSPSEADSAYLLPVGDAQANKAVHDAVVAIEIAQWRAMGFKVTPQVTFMNPATGVRATADYVVSMRVTNPWTLFLSTTFEPILVRDVKTGEGQETDNQKDVYGRVRQGETVVPVGVNAKEAGFRVGLETYITELSVGEKYDFTRH